MRPGIRFLIGLTGPSLTKMCHADLSVSAELLVCFTVGQVKNTFCTMRTLQCARYAFLLIEI